MIFVYNPQWVINGIEIARAVCCLHCVITIILSNIFSYILFLRHTRCVWCNETGGTVDVWPNEIVFIGFYRISTFYTYKRATLDYWLIYRNEIIIAPGPVYVVGCNLKKKRHENRIGNAFRDNPYQRHTRFYFIEINI